MERPGLGQRIENGFLGLLELSFSCVYLTPDAKIIMLGKAISKLDTIKFFSQLAWEAKLVPTDKYADLIAKLEEVGRMLGGWKKGLQSPTKETTTTNKTPIG